MTFQKYPRKRGLIFRKDVHVLEFWLYLTDDEKATIRSSGLRGLLHEEDEDVHGRYKWVALADFMQNSGPKVLDFASAFEAHSASVQIRESVEYIANAIEAYDDGRVTQEESFEL